MFFSLLASKSKRGRKERKKKGTAVCFNTVRIFWTQLTKEAHYALRIATHFGRSCSDIFQLDPAPFVWRK